MKHALTILRIVAILLFSAHYAFSADPETICDGVDNRIKPNPNHPAIGRIYPSGGTAWIAPNGLMVR
ncbi:MAG: hypothetical protein AB1728_12215 [Bacteroidota bacterium]